MEENFLSQTNDNLELAVKSDILDQTKSWYRAFGWTITEEYPDKLYIDITHLSFIRPHKTENKDRLQLLQVRVEMMANLIARVERRIRVNSGLWAAAMFLLGAAIAACGIVLCLMASDVFYIACGIVIIVGGVLFWVLSAVLCTQIYEYYINKYRPYREVLAANISEIVKEASVLTGFANAAEE